MNCKLKDMQNSMNEGYQSYNDIQTRIKDYQQTRYKLGQYADEMDFGESRSKMIQFYTSSLNEQEKLLIEWLYIFPTIERPKGFDHITDIERNKLYQTVKEMVMH